MGINNFQNQPMVGQTHARTHTHKHTHTHTKHGIFWVCKERTSVRISYSLVIIFTAINRKELSRSSPIIFTNNILLVKNFRDHHNILLVMISKVLFSPLQSNKGLENRLLFLGYKLRIFLHSSLSLFVNNQFLLDKSLRLQL